jgi:hypothetical protein
MTAYLGSSRPRPLSGRDSLGVGLGEAQDIAEERCHRLRRRVRPDEPRPLQPFLPARRRDADATPGADARDYGQAKAQFLAK